MNKNTLLCFFAITLFLISFTDVKAQPFGGFIRYDGVDDELSTWASNVLQSNPGFTIEYWFRTCYDSIPNYQAILGNSNNIEINLVPGLSNDIHQLCAVSTNNTWTCHQDYQFPSDIEWHHVAVTYIHGWGQFDIYLDGIDQNISSNGNFNFSTSGLLHLGRTSYQTWLFDHFNGYMDELRISDTIRYTGSFTPSLNEFITDSHTKGLWHFNDSITTDSIPDYSGNNNHLFATGNPRIISFDSLVTQTNNTLSVSNTFDSYQWVDCSNNNLPITGETNQSFTPTFTGNYAVEIYEGTCPLITECYSVIITGSEEITNKESISIYPNPASNQLSIINTQFLIKEVNIVDVTGKTIKTFRKKMSNIKLDDLSPGIYFLKIRTEENTIIKKFIKE